MRQDIQKIILRATIVFALLLGLIFGGTKVGFWGSSRYESKTTLVLLPRSEKALAFFSDADNRLNHLWSSDAFQAEVADARYRETEEWKKFSLRVEHPVPGVFVFSYKDNSLDPYSAREAIGTVRKEVFLSVSQRYDALREIEPRFLDAGNVAEANVFRYGITYAVCISLGIAIGLELFVAIVVSMRSSRALRRVVREKIQTSSEVRPWWLAPSSQQDEMEKEIFSGEKQEEYFPTIIPSETEEKSVAENHMKVASEKAEENGVLTRLGESVMKKTITEIPPRTSFGTSAAPANLPVLTEIPDILKATWATKNAVHEDVSDRTVIGKKEEEVMEDNQDIQETEENFPTETDIVLSDSPVKNSEPTAEELKDRLNKLLRGELV